MLVRAAYTRYEVIEMSEPEKKPLQWKSLVVFEGITLGGGAAVAFFTRKSMSIYDEIIKPSFAPPAWLFPAAWAVLYGAMACSAWLIWREKQPGYRKTTCLYFAQLAVNLAWPLLFFGLRAFGLSFLWLVLLWTLVLFLILRTLAVNKTAGALLVPYLLWTSFAAALSFMVAKLN